MHKRYSINKDGRDFIVGDIHGCMGLLIKKMEDVGFDASKDRMFSVGDLIDRGPESMECLRLIDRHWFHAVMGNHEDMMLDVVLNGADSSHWVENGGEWFLQEDLNDIKALCIKVGKLPYSITVETENGDIGICHAQPPTTRWSDAVSPDKRSVNIMLWSRDWYYKELDDFVDGVYETYHGHTPGGYTEHYGNVNFIDTGAFYSGKLTMVQI